MTRRSVVVLLMGVTSLACAGGSQSGPTVLLEGLSASPEPHYGPQQPAVFELEDGSTLVLGGPPLDRRDEHLSQLYVPTTNQWYLLPGSTFDPPTSSTVLLADGRVMAINGYARKKRPTEGDEERILSWRPTPFAELFDPATASWSTVAPPPASSSNDKAVLLPGGDVLLFGCQQGEAHMQRYTPSSDAWETLELTSELPQVACEATKVLSTSQGPVAWRSTDGALSVLNLSTMEWRELDYPKVGFGEVVRLDDHRLLTVPMLMKGSDDDVGYIHDLSTQESKATGPIPRTSPETWRPGPGTVRDNSVVLAGGSMSAPPVCDDTTRVLDLTSLTWSLGPPLSEPLNPALTLSGPEGTVVAAGGMRMNKRGQCREQAPGSARTGPI